MDKLVKMIIERMAAEYKLERFAHKLNPIHERVVEDDKADTSNENIKTNQEVASGDDVGGNEPEDSGK